MAAGNTATISIESFRRDWSEHLPMRALATRYTITRDQVVRLAVVWNLPRRHDRRLRHRPEPLRDPTEEEIWGPGGLTAQIQATWSDFQREQRRVTKIQGFELPVVETPSDVRHFLDDWNDDAER
jgi:hypothetical protein